MNQFKMRPGNTTDYYDGYDDAYFGVTQPKGLSASYLRGYADGKKAKMSLEKGLELYK